jgi:flagellar basal-body rod modification protein FlgD
VGLNFYATYLGGDGADTGNAIAIATETQGVVDSVDLTATPALLSIGGQTYTTDQIKRVMRPAAASSS